MKNKLIRLVLSFGALFVFTSVALGQNTGTISGTVQDQSGAVVKDAKVSVVNAATGAARGAFAVAARASASVRGLRVSA